MRRAISLTLLVLSRLLVVGAVVAGVAAGFIQAWLGAAFVCFDTCPDPTVFFPSEGPKTIQIMTPSVAIELAALVIFVLYCLITRQPRRAIKQAVALVGIGVVAAIALYLILAFGQAHVALKSDGADTYFDESSVVKWESLWGLALMTIVGAWSIILARLQWPR
jgi:hypothetical protein